MPFHFTVTEKQLRLALNELEIAKKNGWDACNVLFNMTEYGQNVSEIKAEYKDLLLGTTKSEDKFGRSCGSHRYTRFNPITNEREENIDDKIYKLLANKLKETIGNKTRFVGRIEIIYQEKTYILITSVIVIKGKILPNWWKLAILSDTNNTFDFSWETFKNFL